MSYCRWSSDNFASDIYAYQSDSGYQIHVATNKIVGKVPKNNFDWLKQGKKGVAKYIARANEVSAFMDKCKREPIGGPCDGESFTCHDLIEFLETLTVLVGVGYKMPACVFEMILEEMLEESDEQKHYLKQHE